MRHRARWLALVVLLVVGAVLFLRPASSPGRVLYLHVRLAPYGGTSKDIQYWIDAADGRVRYAESMPQSPTLHVFANGVPIAPVQPAWYVLTLARRPDGQCAVVYTTILDSSERDIPFTCAGLLTLRGVRDLQQRIVALHRRYGSRAVTTAHAIRMPVPAGTDPIPLVIEHFNMRYNHALMAPGVLTLDRHTGRLLSIGGYRNGAGAATEQVVSVRDLPPGALPAGFFDAPPFSLPDRAPGLYRWLHDTLPWHP